MIAEYESKLYENGLVDEGDAVLGMDEHPVKWNRSHPATQILDPLFDRMTLNTVLYARPAEPYRTALDYLARTATDGAIRPEDCETRTFLHDLPVIQKLDTDAIAERLKNRKCVIIVDQGVVTCGMLSPKQAYVNFSSVCFAGFVKFFSDLLIATKTGRITTTITDAYTRIKTHLPPPPEFSGGLMAGPFETEAEVRAALVEAGRDVVARRLVDSNFGNISCRLDDVLYISQSGSFLDDLSDAIVSCPTDDSAGAGLNPSSELPAHMEIVRRTDQRAVLHGHPLFSVIMSMDCGIAGCDHKGQCHRSCPHYREIGETPIVSGEVGGGPYGLCRTVPDMIQEKQNVIVYGHGVFTSGAIDFNAAMSRMIDVERHCRQTYFDRVDPFIRLRS